MRQQDYDLICQGLLAAADHEAETKRPGYIQGSDDVLRNFKQAAAGCGVTPEAAWAVYAYKHWSAVCSILTRPDLPVSEPPLGRFADLINYVKLGFALLCERAEGEAVSEQIDQNNKRIIELEAQLHAAPKSGPRVLPFGGPVVGPPGSLASAGPGVPNQARSADTP